MSEWFCQFIGFKIRSFNVWWKFKGQFYRKQEQIAQPSSIWVVNDYQRVPKFLSVASEFTAYKLQKIWDGTMVVETRAVVVVCGKWAADSVYIEGYGIKTTKKSSSYFVLKYAGIWPQMKRKERKEEKKWRKRVKGTFSTCYKMDSFHE